MYGYDIHSFSNRQWLLSHVLVLMKSVTFNWINKFSNYAQFHIVLTVYAYVDFKLVCGPGALAKVTDFMINL